MRGPSEDFTNDRQPQEPCGLEIWESPVTGTCSGEINWMFPFRPSVLT